MQKITKTVEVTTVVITHERAKEILKNSASDDTEIQQIKDYIREFPNALRGADFGDWIRANLGAIQDFNGRKPQP